VNGFDASTWQALGATLTLIGLLLSVVLWRTRGVTAGLRGVAWSLLPAAAGLTGTLKLLWDIGDSILRWAVHLVFSPLVWGGVVLAGVSIALFAVTAAMRARGLGTRSVEGGDRSSRKLPAEPSRKKAAPPAGQDKDLDDIEAILRKHGIS
jgi:hypothetical protein